MLFALKPGWSLTKQKRGVCFPPVAVHRWNNCGNWVKTESDRNRSVGSMESAPVWKSDPPLMRVFLSPPGLETAARLLAVAMLLTLLMRQRRRTLKQKKTLMIVLIQLLFYIYISFIFILMKLSLVFFTVMSLFLFPSVTLFKLSSDPISSVNWIWVSFSCCRCSEWQSDDKQSMF